MYRSGHESVGRSVETAEAQGEAAKTVETLPGRESAITRERKIRRCFGIQYNLIMTTTEQKSSKWPSCNRGVQRLLADLVEYMYTG